MRKELSIRITFYVLYLCLQEEDEADEEVDDEEGVKDEDYILICLCLQEEDEKDEDDDEEEGVEDEDDEGEEDVHVNPYLQINREMDSANIFHILAKNTDKDRQNKARLNTTSSNALG